MTGDTVGLRNDGGKKHCHGEERSDVAISVRSPGVAMTAPASGFGPGQRRRVKPLAMFLIWSLECVMRTPSRSI